MTENDDRISRNREIIAEFRANAGVVAAFEGTPLLLLHTTGAKSGAIRVSPVAYLPHGDQYVVFAANGGRDRDPAWYRNLTAKPDSTVELGDRTVPVRARITKGPERDALWDQGVAAMPMFAQFVDATERVIPVVVLEPA